MIQMYFFKTLFFNKKYLTKLKIFENLLKILKENSKEHYESLEHVFDHYSI